MALTEVPIELSSAPGIVDNSTGTAITIDASSNVGIGTSSPATALTVSGAFNATSAGSKPSITGAGNYGGGIGFIDTNVSGMYTDTSGANLKFFTNQSASDAAQDKVAMTIDGSGNVGIGTSSIDFYSNTYKGLMIDGGTSPSVLQLVNDDTGSGNSTGGVLLLQSGTLGYLWNPQDDGIVFGTNNTEQVRIDSSGNVGIGTDSPAGFLEINGGTGVATSGGTLIVRQDGDASTDGIALTSSDSTSHRIWKDGSGKLNIGPSNLPSSLVQDLSGNVIVGSDTANASDAATLRQDGTAHVNNVQLANAAGSVGGITPSLYSPAAATLAVSNNSTERMRIDSSGLVGIGTDSPATVLSIHDSADKAVLTQTNTANTQKLEIGNAFSLYSGASGSVSAIASDAVLAFATADAEAMRIDASGNLLVNTSTVNGKINFQGDGTSTAYTLVCTDSAGNGTLQVRDDGLINTGTTTSSPYNLTTASAANVHVLSNGTLYRSTSSERYKNTIQNATHGLTELLTLRPVTYKGNDDGDLVFGGLIAEEVHDAGLTEFVQYNEENQPDALAYGNMVSLCIKAIQEQQDLIQSLRARVAQLEGAN